MTKRNPNALYLEECLAFLLDDKKVAAIAVEEIGSVEQVRKELAKKNPFENPKMEYFSDRIMDLLSEGEIIDSATIECLSSYSATSDFDLIHYGGIYYVRNFEFGDSGYFKTAEDAKAAVEDTVGFAWDNPKAFSSDIDGDTIADLIQKDIHND